MLNRLKHLEENLVELESLRHELSYEELAASTQKEWALRYGLLESIQIIIDISCHLAGKFNLGNPETYAQCIRLLAQFGYVSDDLAEKLVAMIGLRNILVHDYMVVDLRRLFDFLENVADMRDFARSVQQHV